MTKKQIYKKFNNLSEKELTTKNNKKTYVRNKEQKLIKKDLLQLIQIMQKMVIANWQYRNIY